MAENACEMGHLWRHVLYVAPENGPTVRPRADLDVIACIRYACGTISLLDKKGAPTRRAPGTRHTREPDNFDAATGGAWIGADWEDTLATHALFIEAAERCGLDMRGARALAAGAPSDRAVAVVDEIVNAAIAAGFDAYDSHTRTWIFLTPVTCDACVSGSCRSLTVETLRRIRPEAVVA